MMTDQPSRLTAAELDELLAGVPLPGSFSSLGELIAWHERKAELLSRIAAAADSHEAHEVAAEAWDQLATLATQLRDKEQPEGEQR